MVSCVSGGAVNSRRRDIPSIFAEARRSMPFTFKKLASSADSDRSELSLLSEGSALSRSVWARD
jgi:hypothetical protein